MTDRTPSPSRDIAGLIDIMARLRTPVSGCPWDLAQTFETIAPYTIEEAYEVADAIRRRDLADLRDELGDLLLQVVYHSRMAEERGAFDFGDVVDGVSRKMIRRHPHVFGDAAAASPEAVDGLWARIKAEERSEKAAARARLSPETARAEPEGVLGDVPLALPALKRAVKLQDRAAGVGFDWPSLAPVFDKLKEEVGELETAIAETRSEARPDPVAEGAVAEELGDILFVIANVARHLKVDPEAALAAANTKFTRRFAHIEERLAKRGLTPRQSTLAEMDVLWDEAKAKERTIQGPPRSAG